ncbi:hypothetical protein ACHAXR_012609 [Thalassiosira sp. AJA248-18]
MKFSAFAFTIAFMNHPIHANGLLRGNDNDQPVNRQLQGTALVKEINHDGANRRKLRNPANNNDAPHRILQESKQGTFLLSVTDTIGPDGNGSGPHEENLNVELADGIYKLKNVPPGFLKRANPKSGTDKVKIPKGAAVSGVEIDLKNKDPEVVRGNNGGGNNSGGKAFDRRDLEAVSRTPEQERNLAELRTRQLQTGDRTLLVVRVRGADATTSPSESTLNDNWFGTNTDPHNLKSQYAACSYNKLTFSPVTSIGTDGVVTVTIANTISGASDGTIRNAVTAKLRATYGTDSGLADHVALCLPAGTSGGWIEYAYIHSWLSVFNNNWCNYLSIQVHEIGHNLGYDHSGEGSNEYGDQSGMMGYSYSSDDGNVMCFNGAKSWLTGWYTDKSVTVEPTATDGNECYEGALYGVADYGTATSNVLVKINNGSNPHAFINFNRQNGINSGTREAGNQVTVTTARDGYSPSNLVAKLNAGGAYSGRFGGKDMVVTVNSISTDGGGRQFASVLIAENGVTSCGATSSPTKSPTVAPTTPPTPAPTPSPVESFCGSIRGIRNARGGSIRVRAFVAWEHSWEHSKSLSVGLNGGEWWKALIHRPIGRLITGRFFTGSSRGKQSQQT